jgi:hypothetical protein
MGGVIAALTARYYATHGDGDGDGGFSRLILPTSS